MNFHFVTLFPGSFKSYLGESIISRAIKDKKIKTFFYNPRDFSQDKLHRIDRKPYGGGPGMVIEALPVIKAIAKALTKAKSKKPRIIFFSPSGKEFTNEYASKLSSSTGDIIFVCGRYEGIDARVKKVFKMEEVSVGPYVLTGGELPAMVVMDAVSRRIPGVLGKIESLEENRVASPDVYTRPQSFSYKGKKYNVPKVLISGHHGEIDKWRDSKKGKNKK